MEGDLEHAKRLCANGDINIHALKDYAFYHACANGRVHVAKWLHGLGGVDIHTRHDKPLRRAFDNGHADTVKWLHELGVSPHVLGRDRFQRACGAGHLEIAQWLQGLGDVDVRALEKGLRDACWGGHVEVVKWVWLHVLVGHPLKAINQQHAFQWACDGASLEIMQWLHGLGGIDIHAEYDSAFRSCCKRGQSLHIARWLLSLEPQRVWLAECLDNLRSWTLARDAWMRSVVRGAQVPVPVPPHIEPSAP